MNTGFKEFESAQRALTGIETVSIIRKNQIEKAKATAFRTFYSLAVSYLIIIDF